MTTLNPDDRTRCEHCLEKLNQTKLLCLKSIQYLLEQQRELDECLSNLHTTHEHAHAINQNVSKLNENPWLIYCSCFSKKKESSEMESIDQNQWLILPFPTNKSNLQHLTLDLNELEKDLDLEKIIRSIDSSNRGFSTKEEFEQILFDEYTSLFQLAKKLTKTVQILHDTIELLGSDIKSTLEHMQTAQPRLQKLLKAKVPLAFAQMKEKLIT